MPLSTVVKHYDTVAYKAVQCGVRPEGMSEEMTCQRVDQVVASPV